MTEKFKKSLEGFVTQRIDDLNTDAPEQVTEAITQVGRCSEKLVLSLTPEQNKLWDELDDAFSMQVGEETRYFYRAGFVDAHDFIFNMKGTNDLCDGGKNG